MHRQKGILRGRSVVQLQLQPLVDTADDLPEELLSVGLDILMAHGDSFLLPIMKLPLGETAGV